jgi:hypothetical protein
MVFQAGTHVEVQPGMLGSFISSPKKATIRQREKDGHYTVQLAANGGKQSVVAGKIRALPRKTAEFGGNVKMGIKVERTGSNEIRIKMVSESSSAGLCAYHRK